MLLSKEIVQDRQRGLQNHAFAGMRRRLAGHLYKAPDIRESRLASLTHFGGHPTLRKTPKTLAGGVNNDTNPLLFPIPLMQTFRNGWAKKCVPFVNFPNRRAYIFSGSLFDQIAHRSRVAKP
jgi:hypothetical protein